MPVAVGVGRALSVVLPLRTKSGIQWGDCVGGWMGPLLGRVREGRVPVLDIGHGRCAIALRC